SRIAMGEARATLALMEASASWEPESVRLEAQPTAEGFTLNGVKMFVPDAAAADFIICAGRRDSDLGLFIVPAGTTGVPIADLPAIDPTRKLYRVEFDDAPVAEADFLAIGDSARDALDRALATATVALTAEMVGGMQRVLEIAVEYAKARKQFGKPI